MSNSRTLNAKRNIVWGIINKLAHLIIPFIIRTIIIYMLGVEYVGLNSLFTSILSTLSLAELGFGTAIVTIMYRSVANNDNDAICSLLKYVKNAYVLIGVIVLTLGVICCPFLEYLIDDVSEVPVDINIYFLFSLFLINTVISYFFGGYRACLFDAYQRQDVTNKINTIVFISISVLQIILLIITKNYYVYVFFILLSTLLTNLFVYFWAKFKFPSIFPKGTLKNNDKKQLKKFVIGTFYGKIGSVLSVSFDSIVISTFLGIVVLGYYSNYYYILTAVQAFLMILYSSMKAGIGNSIYTESKEKNFNDMMKFTFIFNWIVGWCTICLLFLYNPFVELWIGVKGVLPVFLVVSISLYFYVTICCGVIGTYKAAAGIWWEDRYRCIIGGIVNLTLNVITVLLLKPYGLFYALLGVIVSTIISQIFIQIPWSIIVTFKCYFNTGLKKFLYLIVFNFIVTISIAAICYPFVLGLDYLIDNNLLLLLFRGILVIFLPNLLYYLAFHKSSQYKPAKEFIINKLVKRSNK